MFWKYYFGHTTLVHRFHLTLSEFFLFQILWQNIFKPIKTSEKDPSFYNTVLLKNPTHVTNLNSFEIENNMLPKHSQKLSQFTNFPANMFPFGVRKNICTAPFPDAQELLSWSTLKANHCIFLYASPQN